MICAEPGCSKGDDYSGVIKTGVEVLGEIENAYQSMRINRQLETVIKWNWGTLRFINGTRIFVPRFWWAILFNPSPPLNSVYSKPILFLFSRKQFRSTEICSSTSDIIPTLIEKFGFALGISFRMDLRSLRYEWCLIRGK